MIKDLLHELQKRRVEEDEARGLFEEMQRNFHEPRPEVTKWNGN